VWLNAVAVEFSLMYNLQKTQESWGERRAMAFS